MDIQDPQLTIVIDNGSHKIKAGLSDKSAPIKFHSVVGHSNISKEIYVGEDALDRLSALDCKGAIRYGKIRYRTIESNKIKIDKDLEKLWNYTYQKLKMKPERHRLLMTETWNDLKIRTSMTEILFEKFRVPYLLITTPTYLSHYLIKGQVSSGIIVDLGDEKIQLAPFLNGNFQSDLLDTYSFGGRYITNYMLKLIKAKNSDFPQPNELRKFDQFKHDVCYVALNPQSEIQRLKDSLSTYTFPNRKIKLHNEMFLGPECLFDTSCLQLPDSIDGIDKYLTKFIKNLSVTQQVNYSNVFLTGGLSLTSELKNRIALEVKKELPLVNIYNINEIDKGFSPLESAWLGGVQVSRDCQAYSEPFYSIHKYQEFGRDIQPFNF